MDTKALNGAKTPRAAYNLVTSAPKINLGKVIYVLTGVSEDHLQSDGHGHDHKIQCQR